MNHSFPTRRSYKTSPTFISEQAKLETRIELPPGTHTLQLVLIDAKHNPFIPPLVSNKITISIK